jgi:hypothetical protein
MFTFCPFAPWESLSVKRFVVLFGNFFNASSMFSELQTLFVEVESSRWHPTSLAASQARCITPMPVRELEQLE